MALLNLDYYKGTDIYSDGDIEDHILDLVSQGLKLSDLPTEKVTFPILYHLSKERENILCWYPFRKGTRVLEVGAGCGAITGILCENAHSVTCVDLSLRRSRINYERNKQFENLQIFVGNLNDMAFEEKFDYVVINGVLEYAISFTDGKYPYEEFLNNQLKYMKEDGRVLIAIENRLGLKYFAGAPEDHTDTYFLGLNHYENNRNVRTFSKTELTELLKRCGLEYVKYYYPYPDYKFPNEIFTDETLVKNGYGRDYYNYLGNRLELFNESGIAHDLNREGVTGVFANSFLVEAGWQEQEAGKQVVYAKINSDRAEEFRIITTIEQENESCTVYKKAMTEKAKEHLKHMSVEEQKQQNGEYVCLSGEWDGTGIRYPFLKGCNLNRMIEKEIDDRQEEVIERSLKDLFEKGFVEEQELGEEIYTEEFANVFGTEKLDGILSCVRPANIDLICGNIFREGDKYKVIDCEWIFDFWIPKAFIIWRTLNELYCLHKRLPDVVPREEMFQKFAIRKEDIPVFESWNRYFTLEYVKANQMRFFAKEKKKMNLTEIIQRQAYKRIGAGLYVDYGQGFSEEGKLYLEQELKDGRFSLTYSLENAEEIKALRWDPVEDRLCRCKAFSVKGAQRERLRPLNAFSVTEEWDEFDIVDSQYEINCDMVKDAKVTIEGTITYCNDQEAIQCMIRSREKMQNTIAALENDNMRMRIQQEQAKTGLEKLEMQKVKLVNEIQEIYATRGWKLLERIRRGLRRLKGD